MSSYIKIFTPLYVNVSVPGKPENPVVYLE